MREEGYSKTKPRSDWPPPPPPPSEDYPRFKPRGLSHRASRVSMHDKHDGRMHRLLPQPRREAPKREKMPRDYEKPDTKHPSPPKGKYTIYDYPDSPTVKGLQYIFIGGIIILIGTFLNNACAAISLIGYFIAFIGFWKIYGDRVHFPEPHPSNMIISLFAYILCIISMIIWSLLFEGASYNMAQQMVSGSFSAEESWTGFISNRMVAGVYMAIGSLLWLIAGYKLLVELIPGDKKALLKVIAILALVLLVIGMDISFQLTNEKRNLMDGVDDFGDNGDDEAVVNEFDTRTKKFDRENRDLRWSVTGTTHFGILFFVLCFYITREYQEDHPQLRSAQPPYPPPGPPPYPPPPV